MSEVKTVSPTAEELVPISKAEFIIGTILPADVFVKISETKFILIARQGTKFEASSLHVNEKEEVDKFYVRKEEYKNCVGQHLVVAGIVLNRSDLTDTKKAEFISRASDTVFREIEMIGFSHEAMEHAKTVADNIRTLVEAKSDVYAVLDIMSGISNDLIRHSMAVAGISIIVARAHGWTMPATIEKIALGALLHDVGLKELPKELIEKPRHELTTDERQHYETHTYRGLEILRSMPSIPEDVLAIAYEHHENSIGQGYPRRLRDYRLNPLSRVVALADEFADLTLQNVNNPNPKTADEAIAYIENTLGQPFNKAIFNALKIALQKSHKKKAA